jgi:hypothetical protein
MMQETVNGNTVVIYNSIEELPITRFHKFNKYAMIDAGIGSDIGDMDRHFDTLREMNRRSDRNNLDQALLNAQQNMRFIMENINPRSMSFAVLVKSINGQEMDDLSDLGIETVIGMLGRQGVSYGMVKRVIETVKKKLRRK